MNYLLNGMHSVQGWRHGKRWKEVERGEVKNMGETEFYKFPENPMFDLNMFQQQFWKLVFSMVL